MVLVFIPSGQFAMGSSVSPDKTSVNGFFKTKYFIPEHPSHPVTILAPFYLGRDEVTHRDYQRFLDATQYDGKPDADAEYLAHLQGANLAEAPIFPIRCVSWRNAKAFSDWAGFRLPSEAEWERACRAGTETTYFFGNAPAQLKEYAWFWANSKVYPELQGASPGKGRGAGSAAKKGSRSKASALNPVSVRSEPSGVATRKPNPWGLNDMLGNVSEMCEDSWHDNYENAPTDGRPWMEGGDPERRVIRGGNYHAWEVGCRCATRFPIRPNKTDPKLGFRIAMSLP